MPLFPKMRPAQLQEAVRRRGLLSAMPIGINCPCDGSDDFKRLVTATFPNARIISDARMEPGSYSSHGQAEFVVSLAYWQALAKIAFHYYLVHNCRGFVGSERAFRRIRRFVRHGGDPTSFFKSNEKPFIVPFGSDGPGTVRAPTTWCHLLAANDSEMDIVVYVQLFVGPGSVPRPNYVSLAETDVGVSDGRVWAHVYKQEPGRSDRYAGTVSKARVSPVTFKPCGR